MTARTDKIKGRVKQIEGKLTGDKVRVAQGTVQRAKGDVEGAVANLGRGVLRGVRRAKDELSKASRRRPR